MDTLAGATVGSAPAVSKDPLAGAKIGGAAPAAPVVAAPKIAPAVATPAPKGGVDPLMGSSTTPIMPQQSKPIDTSNFFSKYLNTNNFGKPAPITLPISTNTETSTPVIAGAKASKDINDGAGGLPDPFSVANDLLINAPGELLGNTPFIQQAQEGVDAGSVPGLFAQNMLQKLSIGLKTITGVTSGLYQPPAGTQPQNPDLLDKGLTALTQGLGMMLSVGGLGNFAGDTAAGVKVSSTLTNLATKLPLVGKYIAPFIKPLVENAAGFAAYGQLDPSLGTDLKARGQKLLVDIGTSPLYTALGSIKNSGVSLPVSFGLGFGMAKLSGASNQDAVASGLAFSFLDAAGRAGGTRGNTAEEQQAINDKKIQDEALTVLQQYSKIKLTANSSLEDPKAAYHTAIHQTHPDLGGTNEKASAVNSAFDVLSKGAISKLNGAKTEAEKSVATLSGEVKNVVQSHGEIVAHQALIDNLGLDSARADAIVKANSKPVTQDAIDILKERTLQSIVTPAGQPLKGIDLAQPTRLSAEDAKPLADKAAAHYWVSKIGPEIKAGNAIVIGADDLKDHFGNDYNVNNHAIYSQGAGALYDRALKVMKGDTVRFTVGGPGAGKSDFVIKHLSKGFGGGLIYDSTGWNYEGLKAQIAKAHAAGKKVEFYGVIPSLERSKAYTHLRAAAGGHPVTDTAFARGHSGAVESMIKAIEDGHTVYALDTRNIHTEEDVKKASFELAPLAKLEQVRYSEGDVKQKVSHVNAENAKEIAAKHPSQLGGTERAAGVHGKNGATLRLPRAGGFVAPGKIAEDVAAGVKQLKDVIEHHQQVNDIVGAISNSIYKEEGANKVLKVRLTQLVNDARKLSTPEERTNVYHYMEDHNYPLTDKERAVVLPLIEVMDKTLTDLRAAAREAGIYITGDILGEHTPRNAMEKGGVFDKALEAYEKGKKIISNGGKLTTSVGSGSKHRVYHTLIDENGKRTLVAIKDGKVTAIKNKVGTEIGTTDQVRMPKVKEFFDESVMTKLNKLAEDLGITHERHATGKTAGLGGHRAGVSFGGRDLVKTRLGPTSVLAHELGHQIDEKYGLKEVLKDSQYPGRKSQIDAELRALADKRFEGREVTEGFKKYVRKGEEKMAVMFEAYVANREMFKETAPHLYDDFRDFLAAHAELKPFLDIQPSISLGSEKHGGNLVAGISGKEFVDKSGNSYYVDQATTIEIEANTGTRYYKDPLANYALAIERTARATRAKLLLDKIKESDLYKDAIKKVGEEDIPTNFKPTKLQQFRGYMMEPHLAEAFDDLSRRSEGGVHIPVYDEINNVLISALVINPIMHYPNVAVGWGAATAAAGAIPKVDFMHTLKQVMNKDPEYLTWIEHGAPMQYLRQTNAEFADALLKDFTDLIKQEPDQHEALSKALGYANPIEWAKWLEDFSADATWVGNDVMLFNALKSYQAAHGTSYEKTIEEVSKRMSDYRIPPRVLGSRALSLVLQNNALFMFMRFHYSGVIKPWISSIADTVDPRSEQNGGPSAHERYAGLRTLAYFALLYFVYQLADQEIAKKTHNPNSYISMAGPMKIPQNIQKSIESGSPVPLLTGIFSLTPGVKIVGTILTGYDFSNFFKPVYGPGGEGVGAALKNQAAPYNAVEGAFTGVNSWTDFALAQGGIYSPKNTTQTSTFNAMLNVEKPQVEAEMKQKIASGDTTGAVALAKEFNDRLKGVIKAADISNGNSGSDARVQYFLLTFANGLGQKGYAIRMPSAQSMANYEAKQGLTSGQKYLPGSGNKTSTKGKPSDINNHKDPGTVSFITSNGVTLYNRMSNESAVKAQLSGGKIQPGTQLDHIVPLEGGGTNEVDNLQIIPTAMDNVNQAVEDYVGQQVKSGNMSLAQSTEINIRFKAGLGQPLTQAMQNLYHSKYGSKPITLAQIYDYANTVGH